MQRYEMVREIFNSCSNNQMRDVFIEEIQADTLEPWVQPFLSGTQVSWEKHESPDGGIIFDINTDGMMQRITFTELAG
ncbi:MAG: hypothetical protein LBD93_04785 [Treponema sp.]|jgi:hypothetical protein|nr:hypothetical protein [Treponema sp.]